MSVRIKSLHPIELAIAHYLGQVKRGDVKVPSHLYDKFGKETAEALRKQFERVVPSSTTPNAQKFTLRMSNIGKALCQLQMEKLHGLTGIDPIRGLLGDIVEDLVLFLLHACPEITVVAELLPVKLKLEKETISGTLDVILKIGDNNEVYDIKSCSEFAFRKYLNASFEDFVNNDAFGYTSQLFGYTIALEQSGIYDNVKAGGLILVNKSSGEIKVLVVPPDYKRYQDQVLIDMQSRLDNIDKTFTRSFTDLEEVFKKKPTGNRILGTVCGFCDFKFRCWPGLKVLPALVSTAKNPGLKYYSHVDSKYESN